VGRYTSPDRMASLVKKGMLDFIGAARPSIADPFLPNKINEGRSDQIRECIGCNICITADFFGVPIRCTQNPTMGEEWRKGWHPENIEPSASNDKVLVIGGGPAGLECALSLGKRGYDVVLAERNNELGGRVLLESKLPGLIEWRRVIDHRSYMLSQMPNVETYLESPLNSDDILEYGFEQVVIATGATWRADGMGRSNRNGINFDDSANIISPDAILLDAAADGQILVFDDEHYYLASAIAEKLQLSGAQVTYVTTATQASEWSINTLEQFHIQKRLIEAGIKIIVSHNLVNATQDSATIGCIYSGRETSIKADAIIPVTSRSSRDAVLQTLLARSGEFADNGIKSVEGIGDCHAPGTIAMATYAGHQLARQLDNPVCQKTEFKRENYQFIVD
jgi:dimethylamine/trimethylamine dehydrogenase